LQTLFDEHGLTHCVQFTGWLRQSEIAESIGKSDVFVFPTIREVGGNVIVEAMASGLLCIVLDHGGPSELINEKISFKVALTEKEAFINEFAENMGKLAENQDTRLDFAKQTRLKL
jgi:glycosyltransferase involved in cell wall biosynthesis